jgi:GNAT superfamily N-acetyltransferase
MKRLSESTIARLDAFWAAEMCCQPSDLLIPGSAVVECPRTDGSEYVQLLLRGEHLQIACSPSMAGPVRDAIRGLSIKAAFDPELLGSALRHRAARIIGPAYLGYLDVLESVPSDPNLRLLGRADRRFVVELEQRVPAQDWEYSGLEPDQPIAGYFVEGELRSAAGYEVWGGCIAHIGVVTRADSRRAGYGRFCVNKIAHQAVVGGLIAQYQTLYTNEAAMTVGRVLGFEHYADKIYVRGLTT